MTAGPATYPAVAIDSNDVVRVAFAGAETDLATRVNPSTWTISMIDASSAIPGLAAASALLLLRSGLPRAVTWGYLTATIVAFAAYFPFRQVP